MRVSLIESPALKETFLASRVRTPSDSSGVDCSLKARGISHLKVIYSKEEPRKQEALDRTVGKIPPASISFVPPVAGFIAAGEAIKDIIREV